MIASAKHRTAFWAFALAAFMVALGYAAVPLYDLFCRVTGFGGTTQRVDEVVMASPPTVINQTIQVRFDSNVDKDLPWQFRPERVTDRMSIGARDMAIFIARNDSPVPVRGVASYNVTPAAAGKYFNKIQCFCFTDQLLQPGQEVRMPVLFYVDPKIKDDPEARDIAEITLSYTFHRVDEGKKAS
jgi:cytochrome c oxidase assembly protein subunit 11